MNTLDIILGAVKSRLADDALYTRRLGKIQMRCVLAKIVPMFLLCTLIAYAARADVAAGSTIAQRWCTSCHVIGTSQTGSVPQGPPSFAMVAKSGMTTDQLRAFLSHPHGAMPDLALTRTEIDDLVAYIQSLR